MVTAHHELLRDDRTGLLADAAALLRAVAKREGTRGSYEADRDIAALGRVCLHLLGRIQVLEGSGAVTDSLAAARVQTSLPPTKDRTAWHQYPKTKPEVEEPEQTSPPAEEAPAPAALDLSGAIGQLLESNPSRWWTANEIAIAMRSKHAWAKPPDAARVSTLMAARAIARGWKKRQHPGQAHRVQWSKGAEASAKGGVA